MTTSEFRRLVSEGIPEQLPAPKPYDSSVSHAPKRKDILAPDEKRLAVKNALRYFPEKFHKELSSEFAAELNEFGRIYMYRFRPDYEMKARLINE
jgi:urocanate hydratase